MACDICKRGALAGAIFAIASKFRQERVWQQSSLAVFASGFFSAMAESETPRQSPPPAAVESQAGRSTGGGAPLSEDAVRRLVREEVAAAVASALARPLTGAGELYAWQLRKNKK